MTSSLVFKLGAKPPSSPTAVLYPFADNTDFKLWKISAHILKPSLKEDAPTGITINSCISTVLSACFPPFKMFIIGTGSIFAFTPPIYWYSGSPSCSAAALATAIDTPKIAFAPSFDLFSVPSSSIMRLSIPT